MSLRYVFSPLPGQSLSCPESIEGKGASNCLDCQGSVIPSMFDWAVYCHTRSSTSYQVTALCQVRNVGDHHSYLPRFGPVAGHSDAQGERGRLWRDHQDLVSGSLIVGGIPGCVMVDHNIENGEQLAHACGQGHLFVFSFSAQPVVEGLDQRIETCGHKGGHV